MKPTTIQPEVVECPDTPIWAQVGEDSIGKLSTHISSQVAEFQSNSRENRTSAVQNGPFTCVECPQALCEYVDWGDVPIGQSHRWRYSFEVYRIERCSPCNIKYKLGS